MSIYDFSNAYREDHWQRFISLCKKEVSENEYRNQYEELSRLGFSDDMIIVLIFRFNDYAIEWVKKELSILDDFKPIEVLKLNNGQEIIKEVLLRIPD